MRRTRVLVTLCTTGALSLTGVALPAEAASGTTAADCSTVVPNLLAQMTLEEEVGQMVMALNAPGFGDFTDTMTLIRDYHVGSVVSHAYFGMSAADAASYNNDLQAAAAQTRLGIPVLNAADFESGVDILVDEGASLPLQMGLGAARETAFAATSARITAREARPMGFHWTFSPLADVITTPANGEDGTRAFGGRTALVSRLVETQVDTYQAEGLIPTVKHFPGMGGSSVNSHVDLPVVSYGRSTLDSVHLPPFRRAIAAGVETIMTGHIVVEAIDPELPASLSRRVTTGLLRRELGFGGVIITDSMSLEAIVQRWGFVEAALMAVRAGADIVMEIGPTELPVVVIQSIVGAVEAGEIREGRIEASARRVLSLKCRHGLLDGDPRVDPETASAIVGSSAHRAAGRTLARRGITLVRNDGVLPFTAGSEDSTLVVGVTHHATVIPTPPVSHVPQLAAAVDSRSSGEVHTFETATEDPTAEEIDDAVALAEQADRILVATYSAGLPLAAGQEELVDELVATGKPVVVVATGTPYDLTQFPQVDAFVAAYALTFLPTYAFSRASLDAAVTVVFGAAPGGRLPVPIPTLYPFGHGLRY